MKKSTVVSGLLFLGGIFFAALPLVCVLLASLLAQSFGCELDEGSIHHCYAFGRDIGETLYSLGVMGWFALITIPVGGFLALAGLIGLIVNGAEALFAAKR